MSRRAAVTSAARLSLRLGALLVALLGALLVAPAAPASATVPDAAVTPAGRSAKTPAARAAAVRAAKVKTVLTTAAALRGRPYRYGATGPRAFDCSGYVGYVMKRVGKSLPRTSRGQYAASRKINRSAMKPGDLVFFKHGSRVYHVAVYAGGGRIWHARQPGQGVALTRITASSWAAGRVL
ncbi:C40 family peptidase [Motilibacter sp. K478]|nr:C40 family peptidase [Motilibacter aurantiacus]